LLAAPQRRRDADTPRAVRRVGFRFAAILINLVRCRLRLWRRRRVGGVGLSEDVTLEQVEDLVEAALAVEAP
jgi:hypothetical protein